MYQNTITEMSPMAEMITIVERIGTMKEIRNRKINTVIQNSRKQREEFLCLMMNITDTGAEITDIAAEKEKDQNPEREPIIQVQEKRNKMSDTEMVQRNTERNTAVILTSTENQERTRTDEGRIPHTDENNS